MSARWSVLASLAALLGVATPQAQSLGDLARQEAERRKDNPGPTRVITNKDLPPSPSGSSPSKTGTTPASSAGADAKTGKPGEPSAAAKGDAKSGTEAGKGAEKEAGKDLVKDEKYWSGRFKDMNEAVARDQIYADALQNRINSLTADFVNRDDPAQRTLIANDRQRSLDELERLKTAIQDQKKAIDEFQEEARRAGVPPGWLR